MIDNWKCHFLSHIFGKCAKKMFFFYISLSINKIFVTHSTSILGMTPQNTFWYPFQVRGCHMRLFQCLDILCTRHCILCITKINQLYQNQWSPLYKWSGNIFWCSVTYSSPHCYEPDKPSLLVFGWDQECPVHWPGHCCWLNWSGEIATGVAGIKNAVTSVMVIRDTVTGWSVVTLSVFNTVTIVLVKWGHND